MKLYGLALAGLMAVAGTVATAATLTVTGGVAMQSTDWPETVNLQQFDPTLGTLTGIRVNLVTNVNGSLGFESLDADPTTVTGEISVAVNASTAALPSIASNAPFFSTTNPLSAFDGTIDFGGTSGFSTGLVTPGSGTNFLLTGADMDEFVGAGLIPILLTATGGSSFSGANSLFTTSTTSASVGLTLRYDYRPASMPAVLLPAGAPLLLGSLGVLAFLRKKKHA